MRRFGLILVLILASMCSASAQVVITSSTSGTIDENAEAVTMLGGLGTVSLQVTGTFSGTIALQCTVDGSNWVALRITPVNSATTVTSLTSTGIWTGTAGGCASVRAVSTAWSSGSASISIFGVPSGGASGGGGGGTTEVSAMPADATELPAAAALADNTANPTVPAVAAHLMCYDGSTWDRCAVTTDVTEDVAETAGGTGPMVLNVRRDAAAASAASSGDNATFNTDALGLLWSRTLDPCSGTAKTFVPISISSATTTEITAALAGASNYYYVCSINLVTAAANNVALVDDDSDGCGSVTAGMAGGTTAATGWNFAANGGIALGDGSSSVAKTNGTNRVVCLVTSAATQLSGTLVVVAAP